MKLTKLILLIGLCIGFFSCTENSDEITIEEISYIYNDDGTIRFNGSYLEFANTKVLKEAIEIISGSDRYSREQWVAQFGFQPLQFVFEKGLELQSEQIEQISSELNETLTEDELSKLEMFKIPKLNYIEENDQVFILDEFNIIEDINIFHPEMAYLVNANGILKVNGHINQYTDNNLKILRPGFDFDLKALDQTDKTNEKQGIIVSPVTDMELANGRTDFYSNRTFDKARRRIKANVNFQSYSTPIYSYAHCNSESAIDQAFGEGHTAEDDAYCEAQIIGYEYRSVVSMSANYKKRSAYLLFVSYVGWKPEYALLSATYHVGGSTFIKESCFSKSNNAAGYNESLTVYSGDKIDISTANFKFKAYHRDALAGSVSPGTFCSKGFQARYYSFPRFDIGLSDTLVQGEISF